MRPQIRRFFIAVILMYSAAMHHVNAQVRRATATPTTEHIRIDGNPDEPAWQTATPIGALIQVVPKEGAEPTEKTEVRVLVDEEALYFGIICFDRNPSAIITTQLSRDGHLPVDDHFIVALDPFLDHRNGFWFDINAASARADGQISNNSQTPSTDWDGIWNARARITEQGWTAEMVIPFKTLRFKAGQSAWGFNVQREIKRYNEISRWSGARQDTWMSNLADAGLLDGIPNVRQGKGFEIRPYGLVRRYEDSGWKLDGGLDVSKNLAPNLNASLTLNTDFAQTEADTRQVNLTRFPLFYPEKRTFFLEGASVFDTASKDMAGYDLIPFFSRRIGLIERTDGQYEVPILVGTKVSGKVGDYNIGFLDVVTNRDDDLHLDRQNLVVGRVSRNFWQQSYVGAMFTQGNPSGEGQNTLVGVDARLATSRFRGNKNLSLNLYGFRTDDEASHKSDHAEGFMLSYPNDRWFGYIGFKQIGENFDPALGFVPRTGMRKATSMLLYRVRPENSFIRYLSFQVFPELITDMHNRVDNWSTRVTALEWELNSGDSGEINIIPAFERLPGPFEIFHGVVLPPGTYQTTRYQIMIRSAQKRPWVANLTLATGGFYNGTRKDFALDLTLKPSKHLLLGLGAQRNNVHLVQGDFFTQLFSIQATCNISPNISWSNLVQYDNESRILGIQSRFRWIIKPGNDLFLVLNRGWERSFDHEYFSSYSRGTMKLQYTFRF
jgi:hypothetical protein